MAKDNLYAYTNEHRLVIGAQTYIIDEPPGWDAIQIKLKRDPDYYGVLFEFTDGDTPLQFWCGEENGGDLLRALYQQDGNDAQATYQFGIVENAVFQLQFEGNVNFNVYKDNLDYIEVNVERTTFEDKVRTRQQSKVDIGRNTDLDGNAITPEAPIDIELHSKGLFKTSQRFIPQVDAIECSGGIVARGGSGYLEAREEGTPISAGTNVVQRSKTFYAQPALDGILVEDITGNQNIPNGISTVGVNPQWILEDSGILDIDLRLVWSAGIHVSDQWLANRARLRIDGCARGDARMGYARIRLRLKVGTNFYTIYTKEDTNAGCKLVYLHTDHHFRWCATPSDRNTISTGDDRPDSSLFDNSGRDRFYTTGLTLPPIEVANNVVSTFSTSVAVTKGDEVALWVEMEGEGDYNENTILGSSIGWIGTAVFWEKQADLDGGLTSFMNMNISSVDEDSITKGHLIHEATESVINIISGNPGALRSSILGRTDIGYPAEGCASRNILTNGFQIRLFDVDNRPIQTSFNDIIESLNAIYNIGYAYEEDGGSEVVRVEEFGYFFQDQEIFHVTDAYEYEENLATDILLNEVRIGYEKFKDEGLNLLDEFNNYHDYLLPITTYKERREILSNFIASGYAIEIQRRAQFSNAPSDSEEYDDEIFIINVIPNADPETDWKSEKNENFTTVSNVFAPSTSYNLRITPRRNFLRWAPFFKSCLRYKDQATDEIRFVFGPQNNELETQTASSCETPGLIAENSDIVLDDYADNTPGRFSPEVITFNSRLSFANFNYIKNALKNASPDSNNYGYIRVTDPNGEEKTGYIYELAYNPKSEKATYTLLKRDS